MTEKQITALNNVVSGENAAIWAYGFLLAFLNDADYQAGLGTFNSHRNARDAARLKLRALNQNPPRPEPNYDLPFQVNDANSAKQLAAYIEDRLSGIYSAWTATETGDDQTYAFEQAVHSASRYYFWIKESKAFPGAVS
ncbi:MAG: hypothetical protein RL677_331 [Actinomycetota bacterium]|jgi:hypothetical protein